ncbi:hypothetical protein Pelo_608 [Pelomyxa schiedti]|nr:hypothetical protein Pelo_608 [Pelomyxa schiedti]
MRCATTAACLQLVAASKELELCVDADVLYRGHSYIMRLIVDAKWRQSSGISHTELSNHVLCGSWVKRGLRTVARCSTCSGKTGEPVETTLWSLPDLTAMETTLWSLPDLTASFHHAHSNPKEVIAFHVTPKCSSTRSHIKSKIILLVSTIPGVAPFASNPISLCSRDRNRGPQLRPIQSPLGSPEVIIPPPAVMMEPQPLRRKNRDHVPSTTAQDRDYYPSSRSKRDTDTSAQQQRVEDDSRCLVHTKSSMEYISFQTTSNRQCIVDSRSAPVKFPESMIAGIPERIFRRPVIFVFILSVKEEHFIPLINSMIALQAPYEFTLQYGKISNDLFVIGCGHKNVESFCYGIAMRCKFLTGNNPFHMDITKPNPFIKFLGCANNTFSQLPPPHASVPTFTL